MFSPRIRIENIRALLSQLGSINRLRWEILLVHRSLLLVGLRGVLASLNLDLLLRLRFWLVHSHGRLIRCQFLDSLIRPRIIPCLVMRSQLRKSLVRSSRIHICGRWVLLSSAVPARILNRRLLVFFEHLLIFGLKVLRGARDVFLLELGWGAN